MKDGRTHLAHKAEHALDLETSAIVAVTVQDADQGDTTTIDQTLVETVQQLIAVDQATTPPIAIADEIVADKGYHSRAKLWELKDVGFRTYISEPDRPPPGWIDQHADVRRRRDCYLDTVSARLSGSLTFSAVGAATQTGMQDLTGEIRDRLICFTTRARSRKSVGYTCVLAEGLHRRTADERAFCLLRPR